MPIGRDNWRETVLPKAQEIQRKLAAAGVRVTLDERDERPGWKFAEWELRGVPLRLEIGPKDIEKSAGAGRPPRHARKAGVPMDGPGGAMLAPPRRDSAEPVRPRRDVPRGAHAAGRDYDAFKQTMEGRPGFVISPWCGDAVCEAQIKTDTQATIRNMPIGGAAPTGTVRRCDKPAVAEAWFAKSY